MVVGRVTERRFLHVSLGRLPVQLDTGTAWNSARHWLSKLDVPADAWCKGQPAQPGPVLARLKYHCELLKEYVFEDVRRNAFADLPSRRRCLYLLDADVDVAAVVAGMGLEGDVYEVDVVSGRLHRATLAALDCNLRAHDEIVEQARRYWTHSERGDGTEVLFEGVCELRRRA